jgi:hypothetical protein
MAWSWGADLPEKEIPLPSQHKMIREDPATRAALEEREIRKQEGISEKDK